MESLTQYPPADAERGNGAVGDLGSAEIIGILDTIDLPIVVVGRDCTVARFNQAAEDALGLKMSDIGRRPCNIGAFNEFRDIETLCAQVMADTAPLRREVRVGDRWFLLRLAPYTGSDGQSRGAVLTFTNVTGFRESIGQAIYEREYLKAILNTVNDAFVVLDKELRVQTGNRTFYEMFGITREAAQSVPLNNLGNDAWKALDVWPSLRATLLDNHDFRTAEVLRDVPSGGRRTLLLDACRLSPKGATLILLVLRDVTERKQTEEAVRASEKNYRQLALELERVNKQLAAFLETAAIALHRVAADGTILWANDAELQMLGYSREEYIGRRITEFHADEPVITDILKRLTCGEKLHDYEARLRCKDGSIKTVLIDSSVLWEDGKFIHTQCFTRDITEKKISEEALRETNQRLTKVLEVETVGVMFWDLTSGCLVDANDTFLKMMGYSRADVESRSLTWEKFTPPEYHEISRTEITKFMTSGRVGPYEKEYFHKDGTRQWLLFAGSSLGNNQVVEFCVDISARKKIEQALRQSEGQLASDADALTQLNAVGSRLWQATTLDQGINEMLDATIAMLGADMGNIQLLDEGDTLHIVAHRGFKKDFLEFFREVSAADESACGRALRTGERIIIEDVETDEAYAAMRDIARSAGYRGVQSTPLIGRDGKPRGMISTHWRSPYRPDEWQLRHLDLYVRQAADFIERCEIDQALRESEERFRAVVNNSTALVWVKDTDGRYLLLNHTYEQRFGVTEQQFVGKTDFDFFPAELAQTFRDNDLKIIRTGQPLEVEEVAPQEDGFHSFISVKFPLRRADGSIYAIAGIATDITERKRVEESAARLAAIVEYSDDAIFSTDLDGAITSWNRGAERLYGYTEAEAIGQSIAILIPEARAEDESMILAHIRKGESVENCETERRRKNGTMIQVSLTASPIKDAAGKTIGVSKVARDITNKVRARELLEQTVSERTASLREALEQMEEFSYSVSHDLRGPLRAMNAYAGVLLEDYGRLLDDTGRGYLEKIQRSSDRMNRLTQDVLAYSRVARSKVQPEVIDFERLIRDVIHQHTNLQSPSAEIQIVSPLPRVLGHETTLGQTVSNLLNNAVKFVGKGVRPHVRVWSEDQGKNARVWFEDNGIGISPEHQRRIFNMFERVHPDGTYEGTGIGLTIVRKAMEKMGGRVGVASDGRNGSRFWIDLHRAE